MRAHWRQPKSLLHTTLNVNINRVCLCLSVCLSALLVLTFSIWVSGANTLEIISMRAPSSSSSLVLFVSMRFEWFPCVWLVYALDDDDDDDGDDDDDANLSQAKSLALSLDRSLRASRLIGCAPKASNLLSLFLSSTTTTSPSPPMLMLINYATFASRQ